MDRFLSVDEDVTSTPHGATQRDFGLYRERGVFHHSPKRQRVFMGAVFSLGPFYSRRAWYAWFVAFLESLAEPLFMRLRRCGVKMRLWREVTGKRGFEVL